MEYIKAAKHGGTQYQINRIVIHCTVSPTGRGWARKIANYFQSANAGGSAHYVVDAYEIVKTLPESTVAYHAPPNTGSIGVELCDWQKGKPSRWEDAEHVAMLTLAAPLVRDIAEQHDIPLVWLSPADLRAGKRGVCGHVDVSRAWGRTDHGDPHMGGPFPTNKFMDMIKNGVDDVPTTKEIWDHEIKVPWGTKENPAWQADSLLVEMNKKVREHEKDLAEIKAMLKELLERP